MSAFTHWSHYEKIAKIAVVLAEIGYPIIFITGRLFEKEASSLHPNIKFFPLQGQADKLTEEEYKTFASLPEGSEEAALFLQKFALVNSIEPTHNTLQQVYKEFRDQHGSNKPILSFYDSVVVGHLPIMIGAPGIKPDITWAIGLHAITLDSNDTYPFHMNKLPETGPDARALHWAAYQARHEHYRTRELDLAMWAKFRDLGAEQDTYPSFLHAVASLPDHLMTMGIPEFEFARTDLRDNVHYFGGLQGKKKSVPKTSDLPPWWSDVAAAKKQGKKIVAVSQGTVDTNLNEILIPTLEALKEDENVLVIASTVAVEPEEVPELVVPVNARAAKFVPYDYLLPLVDVLVSNGGYGAVMTALQAGVPLVVGGEGQDKNSTNNLIQMTGVGINLNSRAPGVAKLGEGITTVLNDGRYKAKAVELSKAFERYDIGSIFDRVIQGAIEEWEDSKPEG
ncbi:UDP-Glycosyltransferase/glycogen phosphorylase [Pyrenochaeta sp. DS3sAY3a]|nr:UDP-Glycosyltransferase/glycogen phosphorylase [Pyrenochaeta sp. DS3sAY3a]